MGNAKEQAINVDSSLEAMPRYGAKLPAGTVGILGGLGPLAGAHFYKRLIEKTAATSDSDHLPVVLISDPTIPSRVDCLFGDGPSPVPRLVSLAQLLESLGASLIALPSSTTHAFYKEIQDAVKIKVINLLSEVAKSVENMGFARPAVLATTPTVLLDLYGPFFGESITALYPDPKSQDRVHELVFSLKSGEDSQYLSAQLIEILCQRWAESADVVILACTELCMVDLPQFEKRGFYLPVVSASEVLADVVINSVQGKL